MRIALIQMPVLPDKVKNIQTACGKIREAAKNGADFAVLPEMFCCPYDNSRFGAYGEPEGGEAQTALSHLAAELGLSTSWAGLCRSCRRAGSTTPATSTAPTAASWPSTGRPTCLISTSRGDSGSGSRTPSPREMPSPPSRRPSAPWGCASASTCGSRSWPGACACGGQGDLRAGGLQHDYRPRPLGTSLPPAGSGQPVLHRGGLPRPGRTGLLRGLRQPIAVDPWGAVLCRAGAEETTLYADLDVERLEAVRAQPPILSARRTDLYEVREK